MIVGKKFKLDISLKAGISKVLENVLDSVEMFIIVYYGTLYQY
jgi:hypothetical protein